MVDYESAKSEDSAEIDSLREELSERNQEILQARRVREVYSTQVTREMNELSTELEGFKFETQKLRAEK